MQLLATGAQGSPPPVVPPRWQLGNRAVAQLLTAQRAPQSGPTFGNLMPEDTFNERVTTFRLESIGGQWWEVRPPGSGRQRRLANGTYNFVVKGDTIHAHRSWGHVQLGRGERVTFAGEIHFGQPGILDNWTNASGHTRASKTFVTGDKLGLARLGLEEDKFVALPRGGTPGPQLPVWPQGAEPTPIPRAKRKAGGPAAGAAAGADEGALPAKPVPTSWQGRKVDSDLPRDDDGNLAKRKYAIGKGIPKMNRRDVHTGDAVLKEGHGVGGMYTPIRKGVMKAVGKPGAGTSASVVMVDTTTGRKYLFKPTGGDPHVDYADARGVASGHFAERARAGQIAAGALGIETPDVRLVSINGRKGSLTEWVEQPKGGGQVMSLAEYAKQDEQRFYDLQKTPAFMKALGSIEALDYLINNVDRVSNTGNYMIELDAHQQFKALIPIDQELSFTHTSDRAVVPDKTSNMPRVWTPALADKVAKLKENPSEFVSRIRPLVGDAAVAGVLARLDQLHADGVRRGAIKPGGPGSSTPAGGGPGPATAGPTLRPDGETPLADDEPATGHGSSRQPLPAQPAETPIADDEPLPAHAAPSGGPGTPAPSASGGAAPTGAGPANASPAGTGSTSAAPGHATAPANPAGAAVDPTSAVSLPGGPTTETRKKRGFKKNPLGAFKASNPSLGGYHTETTTTTTHGKDELGEDITSSTERKGNVDVNFKGVEGGRDITHTTKGGAKVGAGVHGSVDFEGNTNLVGSATFETRSGLSISPTIGTSDQADASDPQYVEGTGFVVTYKRSTTDNYGVGGGKSFGGGMSGSVNVGHSEAKYRSGSRIFKTLKEATAFRDNIRRETEQSIFQAPPTSVMGALQIPKNESRGGGTASANTIGGSLSYGEGMGSLGYSHVSTTNEEVSVMRTGDTTVDVTRTFSEDTTKDPNIGAFGMTNTKGKSEETGRAITYSFDLATPNGIAAFNRWVSSPDAPGAGATNKRTKTFKQSNRHDDYGMPVKFSASWKDRKWESKEEDEAGNVTETFGGGQDFDVRTGRIAELLGDREQHANAQIEATIRNGKESYAARYTVSGESGDANLEKLGQLFMGAHHDAGASSGFWLLTTEIDPRVVAELERNSKAFRNAKTRQDRMRIYTDYVQENGARMIGGQGRSGSKPLPWNLELPGDPNFPGAMGRAALEDKHKTARDQLGTDHGSGAKVADDAKQELVKLRQRRAAVADKKKYTDLPDELRQEQVDLVDQHISKFEGLQSQSLSLAMRNDPNAAADPKPADPKVAGVAKGGVRGRIRIKPPAPSADEVAAAARQSPAQKEIKQVSKAIEKKEQAIATAAMRTEAANKVLGRMMSKGDVRRGEGVKFSVYTKYNAEAKGHLAQARNHEAALKVSAQKARDLRIQWNEARDDAAKLAALKALDAEMKDQQIRTELALDEVYQATRWAYVVTSDYGIGKDWDYFKAIKCDNAERSLAINTATGGVDEGEL